MEQLTCYITRYATCEQQYLMFIECLDNVYKHIKDFDMHVIVFTEDNYSDYDNIIQQSYDNITFLHPDTSINPEWYAMMYHYNSHPSEYMVYIMDNTMLTRDIHADTVIHSVNTYGCYNLCYNECISEWFNIRYKLIKYFIPELIELGSYKDYLNYEVTPYKVSAQGNQLFTSHTAITKMFNKFPSLLHYVLSAKTVTYDNLKQHVDLPIYVDHIKFIRDIRSLCDYVTSQCFFYTYTFPEKIEAQGSTPDCMYGCVITNWTHLKNDILGRYFGDRSWAIQECYWHKYLENKNNPELSKCFCKFSTLRTKV